MDQPGKYKLIKKIGAGSFGLVYLAVSKATGEKYVIKMESTKSKSPQLFSEFKLYKILQGGSGIPKVYQFGSVDKHNIMVMELLGPSIEELFIRCGKRFSLKTVLMLGSQMLRRLDYMHKKDFIHRDVKPDNFVMGVDELSSKCFIIDMGLAKRYRDARTHEHIKYREGLNLTGTARYASINALSGCEQSRRDDIESWVYTLIYLLKGSLPWQSIKAATRQERYELIKESKKNIPLSELCKGIPEEFQTMVSYIRKLEFDEKPDYDFLHKIMQDLFIKHNYYNDGLYDWVLLSGLENYKTHHSEIDCSKDKEVPYDVPKISTEKRKLIAHLDAGMKKLEDRSRMFQQREREHALTNEHKNKESVVQVSKQRTETELPAVHEQADITHDDAKQLSVQKTSAFSPVKCEDDSSEGAVCGDPSENAS